MLQIATFVDGTIFIDETGADEIGDMSPLLQSKVLRLLQEQTVERVDGPQTIDTDARIVSATSRNLELMIEENESRLNLYHRINALIDQEANHIDADTLEMMESKLITETLCGTSGNQSQAAEMLEITRRGLRIKSDP